LDLWSGWYNDDSCCVWSWLWLVFIRLLLMVKPRWERGVILVQIPKIKSVSAVVGRYLRIDIAYLR
jgi:hypothetical protein